MIDAILGIAIGALFSLTIITMFSRYYKVKVTNEISIESLEVFNNICMEIYHNLNFVEAQRLLTDKEYFIDIEKVKDIEFLVYNNFFSLLTTQMNYNSEYCLLRKLKNEDETIFDVEVIYYRKYGVFEYEKKEVIRKYDFII